MTVGAYVGETVGVGVVFPGKCVGANVGGIVGGDVGLQEGGEVGLPSAYVGVNVGDAEGL